MLTPSAVTADAHLHRPFAVPREPQARGLRCPIGQIGVAMSFGRNAEIYAEGETSGYVYKVVSGVVRVSKLLPDGRRQISAFHMPGEMFGFEADETASRLGRSRGADQGDRLSNGTACSSTGKQSASFVRELLNLTVLGLGTPRTISSCSAARMRSSGLPSFSWR